MEAFFQVANGAFLEGVRLLGESGKSDVYGPVQGSLFDNDDFELSMLIVVTVLVIGLGSLAAGAGIGGGGLFVPLFAFVLGVGAKAAVPMSKATILGGALGNMMSLAFARHPDTKNKSKPLIDYEASTFMQSGELLGVVFGVLLNLVLPEIIIIVFLAVLLSFNAYKTLQKAVSKYKDESKKMAKAAAAQQKADDPTRAMENGTSAEKTTSDSNEKLPYQVIEGFSWRDTGAGRGSAIWFENKEEDAPPEPGSAIWFKNKKEAPPEDPSTTDQLATAETGSIGNSSAIWFENEGNKDPRFQDQPSADAQDVNLTDANTSNSPELQKILDEDAQQFPIWAWALLAPMTIYTIIYAIIKKEVVSTCRPVAYWLWYFSPVPVLGLFMYGTARILKQKHKRRVEAGYTYHGDGEEKPDYRDLKWTDDTLKKFPLIAVLAGVAAGLLGIGGGMVIGPLFIQLDMQPKVGSSSCAFMILWTAVSGVVQYSFAGKLGWQFILYGIIVGFVSGQLGQRLVDRALRKSGRPSLVIFLLGGIVLVACLAMTCTGTFKLIKGLADGDDLFTFDTSDMECNS